MNQQTKPPETTDQKTKRLKAIIHVAKSQLHMDDGTYRAMLSNVTKKTSTNDMRIWELERVIDHCRKLGFRVKRAPTNRELARDNQSKKIRALWLQLASAGLVRDSGELALAAYVKRQTGVEALQWLSTEQASRVIEALKKWLGRAPSK